MRTMSVILVGLLVVAACDRGAAKPAPGAAPSSSANGSIASAAPTNDGTDPRSPILSPDDATFVDARKGWGWSDRCSREIKQGTWGWAGAACDRGLALPAVDPQARPMLLFDLGLIAKHAGKDAAARNYFALTLALRAANDPARADVLEELASVVGKVESKPFPCGGIRCSGTCCDDGGGNGGHRPTCFAASTIPDWCSENRYALRGTCDPKTNEPCVAGEKCCLLNRRLTKVATALCVPNPGPGDCVN